MRRTGILALAMTAAGALLLGQAAPALARADVPMRTPRAPRIPGASGPRVAPTKPAKTSPRTASLPQSSPSRTAPSSNPQPAPQPSRAPAPSFAPFGPPQNPFGNPNPDRGASVKASYISICCAWGNGIKDGITFSVEAPNTDLYDTITKGVMAWQSAVGVKLRRVDVSQAEVNIRFETMGSNTQGSTTRHPDANGFIQGADVTVAGSYYLKGNSPDLIEQIAKHEFGHVLGANHANGDGYLMSPTLTGGSQSITACDKAAVLAADDWFLVSHLSAPVDPVARVTC